MAYQRRTGRKYPMYKKGDQYRDKIVYDGETYHKMLHTKGYIYYGDEEDNVLVFRTPSMELLSDNVFARNDFLEELHKRLPTKNWIWIDKEILKYTDEMFEGWD